MPLGTPTSFIAKRTFRNEHDGGGDPLFVHSPDVVDGKTERASERANGDIRVSTLLLLLCRPQPPRPALLCLFFASSRMRA